MPAMAAFMKGVFVQQQPDVCKVMLKCKQPNTPQSLCKDTPTHTPAASKVAFPTVIRSSMKLESVCTGVPKHSYIPLAAKQQIRVIKNGYV